MKIKSLTIYCSHSDNLDQEFYNMAEEIGYFPDEMHDILKVKFASQWESIDINDKQVGLQVVNSSARKNTKEFEVYADQIRISALTELGIRLMLPNEYK